MLRPHSTKSSVVLVILSATACSLVNDGADYLEDGRGGPVGPVLARVFVLFGEREPGNFGTESPRFTQDVWVAPLRGDGVLGPWGHATSTPFTAEAVFVPEAAATMQGNVLGVVARAHE